MGPEHGERGAVTPSETLDPRVLAWGGVLEGPMRALRPQGDGRWARVPRAGGEGVRQRD